MYSACGPQVDVFQIDEETGALKDKAAIQSFSLVGDGNMHKSESQMDFGGLRHGGHVSKPRLCMLRISASSFTIKSCDLSPDGTKLYVADMYALPALNTRQLYSNVN